MGLTVFVEMGVGLAELPPGGNRATGALGAPSMGARAVPSRGGCTRAVQAREAGARGTGLNDGAPVPNEPRATRPFLSARHRLFIRVSDSIRRICCRNAGTRKMSLGPVAQRIEQQPSKLTVAGSIPAGVAIAFFPS